MLKNDDIAAVDRAALFSRLPVEWGEDLIPQIQRALREAQQKVVVLDDDPTGTQTVHDTIVLTEWSLPALVRELESADPVCYILTNTRSVSAAEAIALNREIARNLRTAAQSTGRRYTVISRSDSTLRGHFPAETDALAASAEAPPDGVLVIPAFMAGGRYTIRGLHYVAEGPRSSRPRKRLTPKMPCLVMRNRTCAIGLKRRLAGESNRRTSSACRSM